MTGKADLLRQLVDAENKLAEIRALIVRHAQRRAADYPAERHIPLWEGYNIPLWEIMAILNPELDIPIYPPRPGFTGTCEGCHPEGNEAGRQALRRK